MKYAEITRTREVPHTIDGRTSMIEEEYTVLIPVPPRDWDQYVLTGVSIVTVAVLMVAVVWSTASIGDLLCLAVIPLIAYGTATVFDLAWIACMAMEWLSRYDDRKARAPRIAGWFALLVAMTAVGAHGALSGSKWVGVVGALVSALAKGLWTLSIRHNAKPLDARAQKWLNAQTGEIGARLALASARRQLARAEGQEAALAATDPGQDTVGHPDTVSDGVRRAVQVALKTMPDYSPEDIADTLADSGIPVDADTVRSLSGPDTDTKDSRSDSPVRPLRSVPARTKDSVTDTIRTARASGVLDPDAIWSVVLATHPDKDVPRESVVRLISRVKREESAAS